MSMLQFVLDRWWPHVVGMSRVLHLTVIWGADGVSCGAQNVLFSMPERPLWHPGGHRAIQGHFGAQEGRRWDPGLDFCRFRTDFGTTF